MELFSTILSNCCILLLVSMITDSLDTSPLRRSSSAVEDKCYKSLQDFADAVSNYTYCAVESSRPFRFCCKCKEDYISALNEHVTIKECCSHELAYGEKYQIVESTYFFVVDLWKRSNCPSCFNGDSEEVPTGIKDDISHFFQKMDEVEHCFYNNSQIHIIPIPVTNVTNHTTANTSSLNPVCKQCKAAYDDLRNSYQRILDRADSQENKVCADVSAAITFIRQRWSKDFHCMVIYKDLVSVVALTCFFCFLPIIFYTSVKLNGDSQSKRKRVPLRINYQADSHSIEHKS